MKRVMNVIVSITLLSTIFTPLYQERLYAASKPREGKIATSAQNQEKSVEKPIVQSIGFERAPTDEEKRVKGSYNSTIKFVKNTTMILDGNTTIAVSSGNAIELGNNITLTISLNGYTLNASTRGISKAGIRVPSSSKLIIKEGNAENGQLITTGGPGTVPTQGSDGGDSDPRYDDYSANPEKYLHGGSGGAGGNGGNAPGAGIGGNGGSGGSGGASVSGGDCWRQGCEVSGKDGIGGGNALKPSDGTSGSVYLFGKIKVQATGGTLPSTSLGTSSGGVTKTLNGRGPYSGGGGGNGATAFGAAGIGAGGVGGGGGGSGGSGGGVWLSGNWTHGTVLGSGGGGGGGQSGGRGGSRGYRGDTGEDGSQTATDGSSGSTTGSGGSGGPRNRSDLNYWAGAGGYGGSSDGKISNSLGNTFVSEEVTLNASTSSGSSVNSAGNKVYKNKMVLLSECEMLFENADDIKYTGNAIEPTVILKDRRGNEIKPIAGTNYKVSYDNNTDAGENTAKYVFTNTGDETSENYLYVDGGVYPATFTIHPNDDPINIIKTDARMTYTYGESFQMTVDKHTKNDGTIKWNGVLDDAHTGDATGEDQSTAEVMPTKVGKLKLKATIVPDKKNGNGTYNFVELSATLDDDIQVNRRDIAESLITIPALRNYYYIGAQIQPHYTVEDSNSIIQYKTNKDIEHVDLVEGDDYTLEYGKNLNVKDKGLVTIKGTGNYSGEVTNREFTVLARDINDTSAVSVSIGEQEFTGKDLFAKPVVKIFDNVLPASDVNLNYDSYEKDNTTLNSTKDIINIGKKQITIVGTGNLSGQRTIDFDIVKADIGKIDLEVINAKDVYFDGVPIESRPTLKYGNILLTEDGTSVDTSAPIINPNDYTLSFENIKEVGTSTITVSGMENFKGSKTLTYEVKQRPLYILPDSGQWKYYGAKDVFGENQENTSPTYKPYIRKLNAAKTEELKDADVIKDAENQMFIQNNIPIEHYPISLLGSLSREGADNIILNDKPNMTYKYTINTMKLSDDTKKNYDVRLIDNQNYYKLESYSYSGKPIDLKGTLGKNEWYVQQPVNLVAPEGHTISKFNTLDGNDNPWFDKVSFDDGDYSKMGVTYFLRLNNPGFPDDGAITDGLNASFKQDTKAPKGNLVINSDNWNVYNPATEFNFYLNGDANGMVLAEDGLSLVSTVHYYITDHKMGKTELDTLKIPEGGGSASLDVTSQGLEEPKANTWIRKNQLKMAIDDFNKKSRIIYVRIEDGAGNVTYVNSDGIVFDKDAPILKAEYKENNVWTTKEDVKITGNVFDETSGLKDRYVAYQINDGALQIIETLNGSTGDFSIEQLKDGDYQLVISAWDRANNEAAPISFHVMKDTEMPRILLHADTTTIASEQAITFSPQIGASKVAKLEVRFNDGSWQTVKGAGQAPYTVKENGTYTFRITNGANVMSKESSITFTKIDTKIPVIKAQLTNANEKEIGAKQYANSSVNVSFANVEKNLGTGKYEYQLNNGAWTSVTANLDREAFFNLTVAENIAKDEMHSLRLRITAANGLVSEKTLQFGVDLTKPNVTNAISVKSVENTRARSTITDLYRDKKQQVTMNATDSLSGVNEVFYYIVKGNDTTKTLPSDNKGIEAMVKTKWIKGNQCEIEKGSDYIVYFKVSDHAGNIAYGRSDRISIDDEAPQIEVTYENEGKWDHDPVLDVYVWDARPGVDQVRYEIYEGENKIKSKLGSDLFTIDHLNLNNGHYEARIIATDKSSNETMARVDLKIDNDRPEVVISQGIQTDRLVEILVDAQHSGASGLRGIQLSKNGQPFEYIDQDIVRGVYAAEENGTYIFRAVSNAGVYSDTKTIVIDKFTATEETLKAVVKATTKDSKTYSSKTWTKEEVTLNFSNSPANLKGLQYQLKVDDGSWQIVGTSDGYTTATIQHEGKHHFEFKTVLLSNGKESNTVVMDVYLDKSKPNATMEIKDISWNDNDFIDRGFSFDTFFDATQYAEVVGNDSLSELDYQEMFLMKRSDLPSSFKGVDAASKIEHLGKDKWQRTNRVALDPNDSYVAFGKLFDKAGNVEYVSSDGTVIDDTAPTLTTDLNQEIWYKDNTTDIHFDTEDNLSEVKDVTYTINGGAIQTATLAYGTFIISSSELVNGTNAIQVTVRDYSGNKKISEYIAKKDTEAPIAVLNDETIVDSGKFVTKHLLSIEAKVGASGVKKVELKTPDAGEWTDITSSYAKGFVAEENGTYWLRVVNNAGNSTLTSLTIGNISKDIPIITYVMTKDDGSTYINGEWVKGKVRVQFTNENANQVVDRYEYKVDNGPYRSVNEEKDNSAIFESETGKHTYTMKLILDNGLESEEVSLEICIDAIAPKILVNSDLASWVKGDQELEVEVIDNESGVDKDGYSFDNGYTWQEENKAVIRANKIVGVYAKDQVSNQTSEKVIVDKIDSIGPTVEAFTQVGASKEKTRILEADIMDYKDVSEKLGSGIAEAYIMTSYPYKNGEFEANPDKTYVMEVSDNKWVTEKAVSVPYNGTNDVWLITEDNVGNMQIYSTKVTNMIGSGDDEGNTEKPKPIEPTDPIKPINPIVPDKPTNSQDPVGPITPTNPSTKNASTSLKNQKKTEAVSRQNKETGENKVSTKESAKAVLKNSDDVNKLKGLKKKLEKQTEENAKILHKTEYIYLIPWVLALILIVWIGFFIHRYRKYKKKLLKQEQETEV